MPPGGTILERIKKIYKDNPEAMASINSILDKDKKAQDEPKKMMQKPGVGAKTLQKQPKKIAKDDSEDLKTKPQKTSDLNNISRVLEEIESKKLIIDNPELISAAKELEKVDLTKLKGEKIYECIEDVKKFLEIAKGELGGSSAVKPVEIILDSLKNVPQNADLEKTLVDEATKQKVLAAQRAIEKEAKGVTQK